MRASKTFICLIGVALCVAPIFSHAQQSNQQLQTLQEVQALRTELAELRDMVERQQHLLSQMQRPTVTNNRPYQSGLDQNAYSNAVPNGQALNQAYNPSNVAVNPLTANTQQSVNPSYGVPVNRPELYGQPPAAVSQSYLEGGNVNQRPTADVFIEERIIDQNSTLARPSSLQNGFPSVEERTIGQANDYSSSQQLTAGSNPQGVITVPPVGEQGSGFQGNQQQPNSLQQSSNIQPSMTLSQDGVQTQAQQPSSGTRLNPLYQSPSQQTQAPIAFEQNGFEQNAFEQNAFVPNANSDTSPNSTVLAEKDYYQQAFDLLKQSNHTEAVDVFKRQISNYPQGELTDDAHYWIAESMYVNRDLDNSKKFFKSIIDNFPQSPRLPDAMLKTAYIEQEQGNIIEARILLQEIIQYHPRSNAAISAKNRLNEIN